MEDGALMGFPSVENCFLGVITVMANLGWEERTPWRLLRE